METIFQLPHWECTNLACAAWCRLLTWNAAWKVSGPRESVSEQKWETKIGAAKMKAAHFVTRNAAPIKVKQMRSAAISGSPKGEYTTCRQTLDRAGSSQAYYTQTTQPVLWRRTLQGLPKNTRVWEQLSLFFGRSCTLIPPSFAFSSNCCYHTFLQYLVSFLSGKYDRPVWGICQQQGQQPFSRLFVCLRRSRVQQQHGMLRGESWLALQKRKTFRKQESTATF